jgi:hypothetical protein
MLTIKNIEKMVGYTCNSRTIKEFYNVSNQRMGYDSYVFAFKDDGVGKPDTEVYLDRDKTAQGVYRLYVMGWGAATEVEIDNSDVRSAADLATMITKCLAKLDNYNFK